ncbi:family 43 glycosylhydrolase [Microbacterium sp.]|uniref:glycoside hydrolase family 43 protein n=1 Tax=Microbacterium sp. TaxID=51671 RepID=UPI002811781A|nr:family 43 glycosylhydrolase [Microbacterium sp.]
MTTSTNDLLAAEEIDIAVRTASTSEEPIVAGFHPDPSICRGDDGFYLAHSSFEYSPGVPIWHSTDLLQWTQIGNALAGEEAATAGRFPSSGGIYAPTLRFHDGRFWLITTDIGTSGGQVITSTADPRGGWEPLRRLDGLQGIDPDLAWVGDDCYVTYCSTDPALPGIAQAQVEPTGGRVLTQPRVIWRGTGMAHPEAPHLYHHDGWFYLVIAEGGTERGHGVSVARSRRHDGPFEAAPANPILTHRSTTHVVQNTGHADFVQTPEGEWAAVYLGVRPQGVTPMFHVNGRETFLSGVRWQDGWPVFDESRFVITVPDRSYSETFTSAPLHPRWVSPGAPVGRQLRALSDGGVEVLEDSQPTRAMSAVVARVTDRRWAFDVELDPRDGAAGVLLRLDDSHWAEVRVESGNAEAVLRVGPVQQQLAPGARVDAGPVTARIESVPATSGGPDDLLFSVEQGGVRHPLGRADGRYLSTEVAGGFTGRVVGFRSRRGSIRVLRVEYTAMDSLTDAGGGR